MQVLMFFFAPTIWRMVEKASSDTYARPSALAVCIQVF